MFVKSLSIGLESLGPNLKVGPECPGAILSNFTFAGDIIYGIGKNICPELDSDSNLWAIDPTTGKAKGLPPLLHGHTNGKAAILSDRVFLFGGEGDQVRDVEEYILP